jgi:hypothetical protein
MAKSFVGYRLQDTNFPRQRLEWAATAVFVPFVALVFLYMSTSGDLEIYHHYAHIAKTESLNRLYQTVNVEYPPLAIGLILATEELAAHWPEPQLLTRFNVYRQCPVDCRGFLRTYRLEMVLCTLVTWTAFIIILRRYFAHETRLEWLERSTAFTLYLWPLGYLLLDRLDIVLACLIMLALLVLASRKHYAWSLLILAAAIDFKFVPLALVPIWLIASMPSSTLVGLESVTQLVRFLNRCFVRVAILTAFLAVFTAPLWVFVGKASIKFFAFHAHRGIEFESSYAAILTLLGHLGYPVRTFSGWGSWVLECSAAPVLTQLSGLLVALFLLGGASVLLVTVARRAGKSPLPVAITDPPLIYGHVLWALLTFVLFSKTFSPQYVIWLAPLAAIVPFDGPRRRIFQFGFLGFAYLTMLVYPRYVHEVVGDSLATRPMQMTGASVFGTGLLMVRLLLLLFLTAMLAGDLLMRARFPTRQEDATLALTQ